MSDGFVRCARGALAPVSDDPVELRAWRDYELASLVENRLVGVAVEPDLIDDARRKEWLCAATEHGRIPEPQNPYWILGPGGERAGTIAISSRVVGPISVASLYVHPRFRRRGLAGAALDAVGRGVAYGFALETSWCWPRSVQFYLSRAMWVRGWARELELVWSAELPRWSIDFSGNHARFSIHLKNGTRAHLILAYREAARLRWSLTPRLQRRRNAGDELYTLAPATFALALAVRGWPLITSDPIGREASDALASRIREWEAYARHRGWKLETPLIPGLDVAGLERPAFPLPPKLRRGAPERSRGGPGSRGDV